MRSMQARHLAPLAAALALILAGCQTSPKSGSGPDGSVAVPGPAAGATEPPAVASPNLPPESVAAALVAFHVGQTQYGSGLVEVPLTDGKLYMQRVPALTRNDLLEAVAMVDEQGQNFVGLRFTDDGARKLSELSNKNLGRLLVLVVNRELVAAPEIVEPLDRGVLAFSAPNASAAAELAAAIRGEDPSAEPAPGGGPVPGAAPAPSVPAQPGNGLSGSQWNGLPVSR